MAENIANNTKLAEDNDLEVLDKTALSYSLLVWNDDVNTFDWVIDTLVQICGHTKEQAEQCALFIHHKGKYTVKKDSYERLKPQCDAINDRNINATIEIFV